MGAVEILFWSSVIIVLYTYIGHPLVLFLVAKKFPRPWKRQELQSSVVIYVSAYNEEKSIKEKINNLLSQDYRGNYKIIIANDGSTDRTAEIVKSFSEPKVVLYDFKENRGKAAMQNEIVPNLDCEIVVFSDSTSSWASDTLRKIVENFADQEVGCVAPDIIFIKEKDGVVEKGQGAYWKYESFLRKYGALVKTNIVASGTTYAIRKRLFSKVALDVGEDLSNPLHVAMQGKRAIFTPDIVVEEKSCSSQKNEFQMRTRVAVRNITGLYKYWRSLNPKYGFVAYQMFFHKYCRVMCWFPMMLAFILNLLLIHKISYFFIFLLQVVFYFFALWGAWAEKKGGKTRLAYIPYYFSLLNYACLVGFIQYCQGVRKATWKTER